jgi:hypothetical protein
MSNPRMEEILPNFLHYFPLYTTKRQDHSRKWWKLNEDGGFLAGFFVLDLRIESS